MEHDADKSVHAHNAKERSSLRLFPASEASSTFDAQKKANLRIYGYTNRLTMQLSAYMQDSSAVFALFSPSGCLLKLYGGEQQISTLAQLGICRGTVWTVESCGHNAVTDGIALCTACSSSGETQEHPGLWDYSICFEPISVLYGSYVASERKLYGGIAAIVPTKKFNPEIQMATFLIANDLTLHISSGDSYYQMFENIAEAFLAFDVNIVNDHVTTLYHSSTIFDTLGVPPFNIYFQPAERLFDPLPNNKELWAIIKEGRQLQAQPMELSIQGRDISTVITTIPYFQPMLNIKGVLFLIATPQRISAQAAQQVGNTAVFTFGDIIGRSPAVTQAIQRGKMLANSDSNVLLLGESGVGKDVFAQAIHNMSSRRHQPFIAINCGALPRELISSELFGYESGAFTGARRSGNIGKFELANGGTLFLDEIGELPLDLQATLLRAVEQKHFTKLGGTREVFVDVRIISATNVDILDRVEKKLFRPDLYYRLSTLQLELPPLRDRGNDILLLADHFIRSISKRIHRLTPIQLSDDAKSTLLAMPWKGNIRELQNMMEEVVQLSSESVIHSSQLVSIRAPMPFTSSPTPSASSAKKTAHNSLTKEVIQEALLLCDGNKSKAAAYLHVSRRTIYNKIKQLGI